MALSSGLVDEVRSQLGLDALGGLFQRKCFSDSVIQEMLP